MSAPGPNSYLLSALSSYTDFSESFAYSLQNKEKQPPIIESKLKKLFQKNSIFFVNQTQSFYNTLLRCSVQQQLLLKGKSKKKFHEKFIKQIIQVLDNHYLESTKEYNSEELEKNLISFALSINEICLKSFFNVSPQSLQSTLQERVEKIFTICDKKGILTQIFLSNFSFVHREICNYCIQEKSKTKDIENCLNDIEEIINTELKLLKGDIPVDLMNSHLVKMRKKDTFFKIFQKTVHPSPEQADAILQLIDKWRSHHRIDILTREIENFDCAYLYAKEIPDHIHHWVCNIEKNDSTVQPQLNIHDIKTEGIIRSFISDHHVNYSSITINNALLSLNDISGNNKLEKEKKQKIFFSRLLSILYKCYSSETVLNTKNASKEIFINNKAIESFFTDNIPFEFNNLENKIIKETEQLLKNNENCLPEHILNLLKLCTMSGWAPSFIFIRSLFPNLFIHPFNGRLYNNLTNGDLFHPQAGQITLEQASDMEEFKNLLNTPEKKEQKINEFNRKIYEKILDEYISTFENYSNLKDEILKYINEVNASTLKKYEGIELNIQIDPNLKPELSYTVTQTKSLGVYLKASQDEESFSIDSKRLAAIIQFQATIQPQLNKDILQWHGTVKISEIKIFKNIPGLRKITKMDSRSLKWYILNALTSFNIIPGDSEKIQKGKLRKISSINHIQSPRAATMV